MLPSPVIDLKAFVPAKDPALSREFYTDLGFTINWGNDEIAELQMGPSGSCCKGSTWPIMRATS